MATRLSASVVVVSVLALLVTTAVGVRTARSVSRGLDRQHLTGLQASAAFDVEGYMRSLVGAAARLGASPQTEVALDAFDQGHRALMTPPTVLSGEDGEALLADYQRRYIEPLRPLRPEIDVRDVAPENRAGVYLQSRYSLAGDTPLAPASIDDAGDGSRWSETHAAFHPAYRDIVVHLDVLDLFLVEAEGGHVVYSTAKRAELGTSLVAGPFSGSGLSSAVEQAERAPDGTAVIGDLGFHVPVMPTPVGFVASPVFAGTRLLGVVVLMYGGAPLDELLSAGRDWDAGGFPPTGETLLFGADGTVRTEPRSYVEDADAHLAAAAETGLSDDERGFVRAAGTTVLTQTVPAATLDAAVTADTSVTERANLLGVPVLSTVSTVRVAGLEWYVLAEVQVAALERSVDRFARLLIVGVAIMVALLAFAAVAWARHIIGPVREISEWLGAEDGRIPRPDVAARSPIEFHDLAHSFAAMVDRIDERQRRVADTQRERLALLDKMLPPAVAARAAAGQLQTVDEVPQASVVVLVVLGLGDLVGADSPDIAREIVNQLLAELDDLAARHQLDRIKVLGDAYFASCGHDRPFIDHGPRSLAFAIDARDAIRGMASRSSTSLDLAAGIHSGSVMAGMTGGEHGFYDVWGETVTAAHLLARRGRRGELLVSGAARVLLPPEVELTPETGPDGTDYWSVAVESLRSPI